MESKTTIPFLLLLCLCGGCRNDTAEAYLPAAPDYNSGNMWFTASGNADTGTDVFYIAPTCVWDWEDSTGNSVHYMDVGNGVQREAVDGSNRLAAALFSQSCRFYSPYYRQITMDSWMQDPDEIEKRYAPAHQDVVRAFVHYMEHFNAGRPFILAGHSQGAKAVLELLKHTVSDTQRENMVAAYLFGFEVRQSDLEEYSQLKPAQDSLDSGVIVCYNSVSRPEAISPLFQDNAVCINPLNWHTDDTYASPEKNPGSVFFDGNGVADTLFHKVGARLAPASGTVIIDGLQDEYYYIPSIGNLFPIGNYHVYEINLYFLSLQKNIRQRINAFRQYHN